MEKPHENTRKTAMKHYTVSIYEKPPKGGFLRYEGILAENGKDLKETLKARTQAT